jgi:cation diffusion facilitator CzcD-associated flavoprotein CzcO
MSNRKDRRVRVCVIGAGPSGITAAKNCLAAALDVVVFEKNDKVGGNWVFDASTGHSSVYENTHIISSKTLSQYEDFPMPEDYPDYPNHRQMQAYFEAYARHFEVDKHIRFKHSVEHAQKNADECWTLRVRDAEGASNEERFDVLMVCNGHHWNPRLPEYPGTFNGTFMHSHDFKRVDDRWRQKRVLVIGAGNSGCDVAVESARVAQSVSLSMRSPQWFIPKFVFGKPSDVFAAETQWLPRWIRQPALTAMLRLLQGPYRRYGLPENKHPALSHHPTANSDLLDFIRHGRIKVKPAVSKLDGDGVVFSDGTREVFDLICACTGFWITFPFFDKDFIDFSHAERVPLYRRMLHPQHKTLYFIGLFQPFGCIWPLSDYQAKLACAEITGDYTRPRDLEAAIAAERPHYKFEKGLRHSTQVDYHIFRRELRQELRSAGKD